jgi:hypothetical protein
MRKKLDENDLARKWPLIFRDGIKIVDDDLGILEISIHGEREITAKDLEQMKKFGYIYHRTNVYPYIPNFLKGQVDILDEDYISDFLVTSITFRRYHTPPLENDGESDRQVLQLPREIRG